MSDIVERLRKGTITQPGNQHPTCDDVDAADVLMAEAADEIILLRRQRDDAKADYERRHKDAVDRYLEVQELRTALSEAEQRAGREALEEADAIVAKALSEGSDIPPKAVKYIVGIRSAIRALIPSEPHDAEGQE